MPETKLTNADIRAHLDSLTKPPGSLGRLEDLAARLCAIQQTTTPQTRPRRVVLFAADHGVVQAGVTAWPSEVTGLMIANIVGGGAASSVFARATGTELRLVDVGSLSQALEPSPAYRAAKIGEGTANLAEEPAMTIDQFEAAIAEGRREADRAAADGMQVVATGEMGIGNTTSAACLACLITGASVEAIVGRGAGADDETFARKQAVVRDAGARARDLARTDEKAAFAAVSGFEIAAMAGFFEGAAERGLTLVVDGFIATAAALLAERRRPGTADRMIAAHCSAETGHGLMLEHLGLAPLLDWGLRLGEGTGALLTLPLLDAAAVMVGQMATFADAGITAE